MGDIRQYHKGQAVNTGANNASNVIYNNTNVKAELDSINQSLIKNVKKVIRLEGNSSVTFDLSELGLTEYGSYTNYRTFFINISSYNNNNWKASALLFNGEQSNVKQLESQNISISQTRPNSFTITNASGTVDCYMSVLEL